MSLKIKDAGSALQSVATADVGELQYPDHPDHLLVAGADASSSNPLTIYQIVAERDSTGAWFSPASLAHSFTYNVDTTLASVSVTDGANTWTQTLSYGSGLVVSPWIKT